MGENNIISINDYLTGIFKDFKNYIEEEDGLCDLLDLNFIGNHVPNYNNKNIVQYYLLRYAFSYMFEYKHLYSNYFLSKKWLSNQTLRILSIGCGNYMDYWGAAYVADKQDKSFKIKYIGIDQVDWHYKISKRKNDEIQFYCEDIVSYLETQKRIDSNYIIFPKSIGEFSDETFRRICTLFKKINFSSKELHLIFSIRESQNHIRSDMNRAIEIVSCFKNNQFNDYRISKFNKNKPLVLTPQAIVTSDKEFRYPDEIKNYLCTLHSNCKTQNNSFNCMHCLDQLNRNPILTTNHIKYMYAKVIRKDD